MKRRRVCILQNGLARGGTDTFVVNLCKAIDKELFDITVVNPSTREECLVREEEILSLGIQIIHTYELKGSGLVNKFKHLHALYNILKKGKFDVFQTNIDLFNGPNLFVAWLAGVPVRCCHSHNSMQEAALIKGMTLPIRIYQWVMRWLCWHFSNRRCGCSTEAMEFLYKGYNWKQDKYPSIIANGIELERYRQVVDVDAKKKELGLTAKYNIVTVGRLIPQKNSLFIAETISKLCQLRDDCDFVWVGIGPLEDECRRIIKENGVEKRVHFLGSRNDVNEILQCCDLFYMPSSFEGLGIVLIEAQASGLKCLVSDCVPVEADCGACKFLSLNEPQTVWVETLSDFLDGKIQLDVEEEKINVFSVAHMVKQMQEVFE